MRRAEHQCLQNEQVERALQHFTVRLAFLRCGHDRTRRLPWMIDRSETTVNPPQKLRYDAPFI